MGETKQKIQPADFVHLHNHTHYSLLDGLQKIPEMLDRAEKLGMQAIAKTDHGSLSGTIQFYKEAKKRDIKPIIGMEAYVAQRQHTDKDPQKDKKRFHLVLLAMNNTGYENLMKLSSTAHLDGYYYKPRIDRELLEKHQEGLIATSACIGSEVGDALRRDQYEQAKQHAAWYKDLFGDRFYLELQDHAHEWQPQEDVNKKLIKLSGDLDIPLIVTADAHYCKKEDQEAHEVLLCVQTGNEITDENRMSLSDMHLFLSDPRDIIERWQHMPEVISNTKEIADRCKVDIDLGKILIPKFDLPKGKKDERTFLRELTFQGLVWRYGEKDDNGAYTKTETKEMKEKDARKVLSDEIIERAEYELDVINDMGFAGYFLIIWDFVEWGKERGIVFGPGRGSAAGSVISYGLNITDIDPLKYDLLFERFLNPDRISMPDIDIDIQDNRRDEVIEYVADKYGRDRVAHIVTFGTMAARNAIRDVSRVLGVAYSDADRLAKMVPPPSQGRHIPLKESVEKVNELKNEYETNEEAKRVIDLAVQLEGTIRSHGVHAAGVVIAPDEITKYTPLERSQKGPIATQYSMGPIEDLGLLKMDFLGLSNLTTIKNSLRIIRKVYGVDIDISSLPLEDDKTFKLLQAGDTTGVFQFESSGMKRYIKAMQPTSFEDLVALAALYRPGPLSAGYTDEFVETKNGRREVAYDHPKMEDALNSTYGILVYQEQVMQIAKDMCGFSGGQADTLRKAIGKKKAKLMAKMKSEFIDGMVEHSDVEREFAVDYWDKLEGFADYCFNKSHSASYALIAYQTAYLKAHYPSAFMAALMTSDYDNTDRIALEISECRHMGIEVLSPDVNESYVEFAVRPKDEAIRYGLAAIKNVGVGAVEAILKTREENGEFQSVADFAERVPSRAVNKKTYESLIKSGAFDSFGHSRQKLLFNMSRILSYGSKLEKERASGQIDLFGGDSGTTAVRPRLELENPPDGEETEKEQLQWERELLGIYLSNHPLQPFEEYLKEKTVPFSKLTTEMEDKNVDVGGLLREVREITTKNGARMAFVKIEDFSADYELIVFPKAYEKNETLWEEDKIVHIKGKVNCRDKNGRMDEIKIIVNEAKELNKAVLRRFSPSGKSAETPQSEVSRRETGGSEEKTGDGRQETEGGSQEAENENEKKKAGDGRLDAESKSKKTEGGSQETGDSKTQPQKKKRLFIKLDSTDNMMLLSELKNLIDEHPGTHQVVVKINDHEAIRLPEQVDTENGLLGNLQELIGDQSVKLA